MPEDSIDQKNTTAPGASGDNGAVLAELDRAMLQEASRMAGLLEVTSGMLHNIGNGLNSVITSLGMLLDRNTHSRIPNLGKAVALLEEHAADLGTFLTEDPKGKQVTDYLSQVSRLLVAEHEQDHAELLSVKRGLDHIRELIAMQQNYAKSPQGEEAVTPSELFDEALRISEASLGRNQLKIAREFETVPKIKVAPHKVIQILVNFIRNAKNAMDEAERPGLHLRLHLGLVSGNTVRFEVCDNGVGIKPEVLPQLFRFGYTTRSQGHGFGLHSTLSAARELGGRVGALSDGPGKGATFFLEIPGCPSEQD